MTVFEESYMGTPENSGLMRKILEEEGIRVGDYNAHRIDVLLMLEEKGRVIRSILPDITIKDLSKYAEQEGIDLAPYQNSLDFNLIKDGEKLHVSEFRAGTVINRLRKQHQNTGKEYHRTRARKIGNLLDRVRLIELSKVVEVMQEDQIIVLPHYAQLFPDDLEHHLQGHHMYADTPSKKRKKFDPVVVGAVAPGKAVEIEYDPKKMFAKAAGNIKPGQYYPDIAVGMSRGEGHLRINLVEAIEAVMNFLTNMHYGKKPSIPNIGFTQDIKEDGLTLRVNGIQGSEKEYNIVLERLPAKIPKKHSKEHHVNWTSIRARHDCDHVQNMYDKFRHKTGTDEYLCKHVQEAIMWAAYEVNRSVHPATIPFIPVLMFDKDFIDFYRKVRYRTFRDVNGVDGTSIRPLNDAEISGLLIDYVRRNPDCLATAPIHGYYTPEVEQKMLESLPENHSQVEHMLECLIDLHQDLKTSRAAYRKIGFKQHKLCYENTLATIKKAGNQFEYDITNPQTVELLYKALMTKYQSGLKVGEHQLI